MSKTLTARGTDGLVAIHETGADISNPVGNLSQIYFHSGLKYLSVSDVRDVTVNLSYKNTTGFTRVNIPLFSHGKGKPVMITAIRDNGDVVAGSMVLKAYSQHCSFVYLTSDSTNVYLRGVLWNGFGTMALNLKIFIFDVDLF